MRFWPSAITFFTSSRSIDDSSPNTIRPMHSIARIPSTVRLRSFNSIPAPLRPSQLLPPAAFSDNLAAPAYALRGAFASPWLGLCSLRPAWGYFAPSAITVPSRIIVSSPHVLHRPGPQIPSAEIFRGHRTGTRHPHPAKRHRAGTHRPRLHL